MLDTYNRNEIINRCGDIEYSSILVKSNHAEGLDWNYFIAKYIDRDLHEKLLAVSETEVFDVKDYLDIMTVLGLIHSGYFYTAKMLLLQSMDKLKEHNTIYSIAQWLVGVLTEADDIKKD